MEIYGKTITGLGPDKIFCIDTKQKYIKARTLFAILITKQDRRQSKTLLTIDERGAQSLETVFLIAIFHQ